MTLLKSILYVASFMIMGQGFAQQPSKKLPPLEQLPKVGEGPKTFYELPEVSDYKVYDQYGKKILTGRSEFIDVTDLPKGTYFISYNDKKESYEVK